MQRAVTRFMPGDTMDEAIAAAEVLRRKGITAILTLLGENVDSIESAGSVVGEYRTLVGRAAAAGLDADISVKPTHVGLDQGFDVALDNLRELTVAASREQRMVAVDMESTRYVDSTLDLYRRLRAEHENVGVCLQSYLYRTGNDLDDLLALRPTIRLVKGAYKEPVDLAYPKKSDVDVNFLRVAEILLEAARDGVIGVAFGTHDGKMISEINRRSAVMGIPREAYEFQMLYGIQRDLQTTLAASGYRMRVLVSYGTFWFPWYMRRLAERPANIAFVARSMVRR